MHAVKAVRVVELRGDHRRHAQRDQPLPVLVGQRAQHPHQRQVGRRPRLVEPFLADRPAAVMGQPRQMGVQDQGEQPGHRLLVGVLTGAPRSRPGRGCRRCTCRAPRRPRRGRSRRW